MVKWPTIAGLLCAAVIGLGDDSAQIYSNDHSKEILNGEDLVVVTHTSKEIMRSYGQHTKVINDAYCSR